MSCALVLLSEVTCYLFDGVDRCKSHCQHGDFKEDYVLCTSSSSPPPRSVNWISQFKSSPNCSSSALTLSTSNPAATGWYALAIPIIRNRVVPPYGAISSIVCIFSMLKPCFAKIDVTLWTMPTLSAPSRVNFPLSMAQESGI